MSVRVLVLRLQRRRRNDERERSRFGEYERKVIGITPDDDSFRDDIVSGVPDLLMSVKDDAGFQQFATVPGWYDIDFATASSRIVSSKFVAALTPPAVVAGPTAADNRVPKAG